jgi:N utilization substance protein B
MPVELKTKKAGIRSLARLAAAQALYQQEHQSLCIEDILEEFLFYRSGTPVVDEEEIHAGDETFLKALLTNVSTEQERIDAIISTHLTEGWPLDRLDPVVRAILRAGTGELFAFAEIPARIVLNEYVELAKAFFDGKEPPFVNGVLHRIAITLRPQEITEKKGAPSGS